LLVALVRRGQVSTAVGFDSDGLLVAGHLSWTDASQDGGVRVGEVVDVQVRQDRAERGVGLVLLECSRLLAGVDEWSGLAVPDGSADDSWLNPDSFSTGQQPGPIISLGDAGAAGPAAASEVHVVFRREGRAVVVAFAADSLAWRGHLAWTINRPGGRLGGDLAGLVVGEVRRVDTRAGFGGHGVATRMYGRALQVAAVQGWPSEIDHSDERTVEGDRWAKKAGGWRPPLRSGRHKPSFDDARRRWQDPGEAAE
jgi:hypothetical protein